MSEIENTESEVSSDSGLDEATAHVESPVTEKLSADKPLKKNHRTIKVVDVDDEPASSHEEHTSSDSDDPYANELEQTARDMGWRSDGELTAEEFVGRKPLYQKIQAANRKSKQLEDVVKNLVQHNMEITKSQKQQQLMQLEAQKRRAVDLGDVQAYDRLQQQQHQIAQQPLPNLLPQQKYTPSEFEMNELKQFQHKHRTWLNKTSEDNRDMIQAADTLFDWSHGHHPHKSFKQHLDFVEKQMRALYPHRFSGNQASPTVSKGSTKPNARREAAPTISYDQLTPTQKKICKAYEKAGFKRSDYLSQLTK